MNEKPLLGLQDDIFRYVLLPSKMTMMNLSDDVDGGGGGNISVNEIPL